MYLEPISQFQSATVVLLLPLLCTCLLTQAAKERAKRLEGTIESLRSELHTAQLNAASQSRQTKELEALLGEERLAHEQVRVCISVE